MEKCLKFFLISILPIAAWMTGCDSIHTSGGESGQAKTNVIPLPETVTFNAHIRPIFSDTCFACHGFDSNKREAGLRLDTPEGAYAKSPDSGKHAIVPGKPDESEVWRRLMTADADDVMPPADFHKDLTEQQKALIGRWIEQGATYEQHWAYTPITKPALPRLIHHADKVTNPIDFFILAKLEAERLDPSPIADKTTLLRRLSLDLTGLPPTPAEVDAFLADSREDAYAIQVERLLASPHYGERMAVPWLDVVRFADTVGYHGDQNMRIFPYRDYVIQSFNDNKPFDQFTIEQLAGDLLPNATDEQRIATGFLRLNLMTREGGAQPKEYLAKSMGDRVRAVGAAWLGLTTGCAECHDHKFDPITAKDFYSLGAFFADVRQWGMYADYYYTPNPDLPGFENEFPFPPEIYSPNKAVAERLAKLRQQAAEVLAAGRDASSDASFVAWLDQSRAFLAANPSGWQPLVPVEVTVKTSTAHEVLPDHSVRFTGKPEKDGVMTLRFTLPEGMISAIRFEALPDEKNAGKVGRSGDGKFIVTPTFAIESQPLKFAYAQADRRSPHRYANGANDPLLEPEWRSAPAIWEEPQDAASRPHHAIYQLAEPLVVGAGKMLTVTLASADIGRVRFSATPFGDPVPGESDALRVELKSALLDKAGSQPELVAGWVRSTTADPVLPEAYRNIRKEIIECRAGYAHSLVAQAVPPDKILPTHLLPRGDWANPKEEVQPAVPAFLSHASVPSEGRRLNRLDLAHWLVSKENPLTARQFTNRLWKQFFGKGLSNVLDDLGNQGEWPSHPELLDWLSSEFRESGWDVKHVVRLIVSSHTYRQRSAARSDLAEKDPANRLLAEQSSRRLDAEFVRDNILAISGLLSAESIGGPSVKPYQPAGYYANINFPQRDYHASTGSDQYRRGLYMHWQRTFMHPMLASFDAPSREECSADRLQSNSPQQALILLNDPSFVEAARAFATRLLLENPGTDDSEKINSAFRRVLAREPKPEEAESLSKFLQSQRETLKAGVDDANALLKTGNSPVASKIDPAELFAWTQVCRVMLNLHETLTRY